MVIFVYYTPAWMYAFLRVLLDFETATASIVEDTGDWSVGMVDF